jgi:hypothetical protein
VTGALRLRRHEGRARPRTETKVIARGLDADLIERTNAQLALPAAAGLDPAIQLACEHVYIARDRQSCMSSNPPPNAGSRRRGRAEASGAVHAVKPARKPFAVRLPLDLIKDVKREAVERDQTVQDFTEAALRAALGR